MSVDASNDGVAILVSRTRTDNRLTSIMIAILSDHANKRKQHRDAARVLTKLFPVQKAEVRRDPEKAV